MTSRCALDTNIVVYAFSDDPRSKIARPLLNAGPYISVQVLNEFANVSVRKRKLPWAAINDGLIVIETLCAAVRPIDMEVHGLACDLALHYKIAFFDSLIVAAALLDRCDTLYSEDMQHGLVIDGQLTITNPFLEPA